ncbi:acyltransferase ChoActase/COT/CPT [Zopfochytrium polystomum]|nr:acyltransferase ChoActase/COT/CPT [Zopfochytrium polystomum]
MTSLRLLTQTATTKMPTRASWRRQHLGCSSAKCGRLLLSTAAPTPTFANQSIIPRLPIPPLPQTTAKYLESCRPLLSDADFARTKAAVENFARTGGFGEVLQQRLHELDAQTENSWLEDIWLNKAYLEWREPSLINVNWWCQFKDHPKGLVPKPKDGGVTEFQLERASGLISSLLDFKTLIDKEALPAEYQRDRPLCMNQYKNQFGVTRIPGSPRDTIHSVFPPTADHVIVICRDQLYRLDVVKNGKRVTQKYLRGALRAIADDSAKTNRQEPLGVLTAGHRDDWFKAYSELMQLSPTNVASFETIKSALFVVCLDTDSLEGYERSHHQIFHNTDASNRWFDKSIQLIVTPEGRAGVNGEHTPADAVIPGRMFDFIVEREPASDPDGALDLAPAAPQKLQWVINDSISSSVEKCRKTALELINDTESSLLQTRLYGGDFIKKTAKASPDAYVQLALQATWASLYKDPTPVYESASTRLFKHGRTETGRSLTVDTWAFAVGFNDRRLSVDKKRSLFYKGIESQSNIMKEAAFGKGIDRHLLGLRCMIKNEEEQKQATLFTDPAYIQSMYFKLSSSNMSNPGNFYGGFGPVVPEGYGVNYSIGKDFLNFSVSCKSSCSTTSSVQFRDELLKTLEGMRDMASAK